MAVPRRWFQKPFFIRLFNWEYWPFAAVYYPVMPIWLILCVRARAIYFFNASNPGIENGGMLNESKKDIHAIMPEDLFPRTIHFSKKSNPEKVAETIENAGFQFPLFGKPDVGGKGRGVSKIRNQPELKVYAESSAADYHIQEAVPFEEEVGIFYFRYPGSEKGKITGIVRKEFLTVTGNGKDTIHDLVIADNRAVVYEQQLIDTLGKEMKEIIPAGEKKIISPYGNHARGSKFIDVSDLADAALTEVMDMAANRIPGFNFGRIDIRYREWDAFKRGEDFSIIEVNGAGAEPTHMYDPAHSIFFAWKEIIRHWWIMTSVSIRNHKLGTPYMSVKEGGAMFRKYNEIQSQIS